MKQILNDILARFEGVNSAYAQVLYTEFCASDEEERENFAARDEGLTQFKESLVTLVEKATPDPAIAEYVRNWRA